jgi:hypothetical protein
MFTTPHQRFLQRKKITPPAPVTAAAAATVEAAATTAATVEPAATAKAESMAGIFVSIPSYRDPLIVDTVRQCISKAKFKDRIFIGVCEQNAVGDPTCVPFAGRNVLVDSLPYNLATGPCYARERIEKFLLSKCRERENIRYVLYIDAHTLFAPNWDETLENLWLEERNDNVFFTGYPPQYTHLTRTMRYWRPCANNKNVFMKASRFIGNGTPLYLNNHLFSSAESTFCIGLSAGFIFAPVEMVTRVPYLTNVPFSFLGEEPAMLLRYFTHGYIPKTCRLQVVQTTYSRKGRPLFLDRMTRDQKSILRLESNRKLRLLLEGKETDIGLIGKEKSVEEFERFCGIDFKRGIMSKEAQCGISGYDTERDFIIKFGMQTKHQIFKHLRIVSEKKRPLISF